MNNLFEKAKWITFGHENEVRNGINPWENCITEEMRKDDILQNSGIPVFCRQFELKSDVKSCKIHLTALGCFNVYVNGKKISSDELMPGWTDYRKRVLYYSYDITENVGISNAVAVPVSLGWWAGRISLGTYGTDNDIAFICVIETEYKSGEKAYIYSDADWNGTHSGPVRYADIWDGEVFDANFDSYESMSMTDYPKEKLSCVPFLYENFKGVISPKVGPSVCVRDFLDMKPQSATVFCGTEDNGSDFGAIHILKKYEGESASQKIKLKKGESVIYDLMQNMVGWAHFTVKGEKNTHVVIRHAEMLNDSGMRSRGNDGPDGSVYTANYRSAKAKVKYTLRGDAQGETYRPSYTFFGFRYIEFTADEDIEIISFKCDVVGSDMPETGFIETSNSDINKLLSNIRWGQRGNYLSIPTDCPQRDESLGWTGDTQVFACTAAYNANVLEFFRKWLQDARDSQNEEGMYPDVIPHTRVVGWGGAAWSDAGIIVPYVMYKMYNDKSIIKECYESMEKYMAWLAKTELEGPNRTYGDWLAYEPTDIRMISIAYYAYDALLMSKMSCAISESEGDEYSNKAYEYKDLYGRICKHFQSIFIDEKGQLNQTSQTAYLLALKFGLLPEECREDARKALANKIIDNGYKLSTGFVGTSILNQTLSDIGESNLAYSLLLQTKNPSWLYSVYQGATTIWERWNSYTLESGFGDVGMNSFNHYAYGVVGEWMYKYMLGIETDEEQPGFKHIILQPKPDTRTSAEMPEGQERITWARGSYNSVSGLIKSAWYMEENTFTFIFTVPENTTTTVYLPVFDKNAKTVIIDGEVIPVSDFNIENNCYVIQTEPGDHQIEALL